jgi:hypothetical protein
MSEWMWIENPAFVDKMPEQLTADCHDHSPFVTIHCSCDFDNHVHESSIVEVPPDALIGSRCNGCGDLMTFPPGEFHRMFAAMRDAGWLA